MNQTQNEQSGIKMWCPRWMKCLGLANACHTANITEDREAPQMGNAYNAKCQTEQNHVAAHVESLVRLETRSHKEKIKSKAIEDRTAFIALF